MSRPWVSVSSSRFRNDLVMIPDSSALVVDFKSLHLSSGMLLFMQQKIPLMFFILFGQFFQTTINSDISGRLPSGVHGPLWRSASNHQQAKYVSGYFFNLFHQEKKWHVFVLTLWQVLKNNDFQRKNNAPWSWKTFQCRINHYLLLLKPPTSLFAFLPVDRSFNTLLFLTGCRGFYF